MKKIVILLSILIIVSCSKNENSVVVNLVNKEISGNQALNFMVSKAIKYDSLLSKRLDQEYFTITPEMEGFISWENHNTFNFYPKSSYQPGTNYKITFNNRILQEFDSVDVVDSPVINFKTDQFEFRSAYFQWRTSDQGKDKLNATLNFNLPLRPSDLTNEGKSNLRFLIDGKEFDYDLAAYSISENLVLDVYVPDAIKYQEKEIKVILAKGTPISNSEWTTTEEIEKSFTLPDLEHLKISKIEMGINDNNTVIKVFTNQSLAKDNKLDTLVKVPSVNNLKMNLTEYGFDINGDFEPGAEYILEINKNIRSTYNKTLEKDYKQELVFADINPIISFVHNDRIFLSSRSNENIALNIIGVKVVDVSIYKIYENRVQEFMDYGKNYNYHYDSETRDRYRYEYYNADSYGDRVFNSKYVVKSMNRSGESRIFNFNFLDRIKGKGLYVIKVSSEENEYVQASQIVSNSDIALIAKKAGDDILLFANSIKTTESMSNVNVRVLSSKRQEIFRGSTDANGKLNITELDQKNNTDVYPDMIIASKGDDVTYLDLSYKFQVSTSSFDTRGVSYSENLSFFYADRELYRPGDEVHLAGIVRNNNYTPISDLPLVLKIFSPTGGEIHTARLMLGKQGEFDHSFLTQQNFLTGSYTAQYYLGEDRRIGSYSFKIEEFMPERIKISIDTDKENYTFTDSVKIEAKVMNLFGTPAKNRNYEMKVSTNPKNISFKKYSKYNFNLYGFEDQLKNLEIDLNGTTNDEGMIKRSVAPVYNYPKNGVFTSNIYLTVFDENGRPVSSSKKFDIYTQDEFCGVTSTNYYNGVKSDIKFNYVLVDKEGNELDNKKVEIDIVQFKWRSHFERNSDGYYRYVSRKREVAIESKVVTYKKGKGEYIFNPEFGGSFEIRVKPKGHPNYVKSRFYVYDFYGSSAFSENSVEIDPRGQITIEMDKESYDKNEKAKVIFKAPFDGKMLVTLERDKIYYDKYINVVNNTAVLEIPVKDEYLPNVFVSAILFKKLDNGSLPLTVAYGYKSLKIRRKSDKINLDIIAVEKSRSKTTQNVKIKSDLKQENVKVTLAAVDEGILQITNYKTPDPYNYFYRDFGLNVSTYNVYPFLYPDLKVTKDFGSGDDDMDSEMTDSRSNPITNKRVKLVALWSGILSTNDKGECNVDIKIPQFSGSIRLMAVAHKDQSFGSAQKNIIVADPIVISASIPRFLSPGDRFNMNVTVSNTENKSVNAKVKVALKEGLRLASKNEQSVNIKANDEAIVEFEVIAEDYFGSSQINIEVDGHGEKFTHQTDITVRPSTSVARKSSSGFLEAGKSIDINLVEGMIEGTVGSRLVIGRSPLLATAKVFDDLIGYPHGCVEQTTSKLFPQLYFEDLLGFVGDNANAVKEANENIKYGIAKLKNMQTPEGGLAYWSGSDYPNWWGSVYAGHFLLEAKKKGYDISDQFMDRLFDYIQRQVDQSKTYGGYYYKGDAWIRLYYYPRTTAYSLYLLSLAGKVKESDINYYRSQLEFLNEDAKFMLAAAAYLSGDKEGYKAIIPDQYDPLGTKRATGRDFHSHIRAKAIALLMLLETNGDKKLIDKLSEDLIKVVASSDYLSTQDRAFIMLALGKIALANKSSLADGKIIINGKTTQLGNNSFKKLKTDANNAKIVSSEEGRLYYYWSSKGLPKAEDVVEEDSKLKVTREYFERDGETPAGTDFQQGDLVIVKLTLEKLDKALESIDNVVMTDMLPACFEIENPRLSSNKMKLNFDTPEFMDPRDDRMNVFYSLENGSEYRYVWYDDDYEYEEVPLDFKVFYYQVRVVTKGTFNSGVYTADAMYDGSFRSYHKGGVITVK